MNSDHLLLLDTSVQPANLLAKEEKALAALILILGLIQITGGVFVAVTAKSAVHEILGAIAFGFGVISFALAVIIAKIDDAVKAKQP